MTEKFRTHRQTYKIFYFSLVSFISSIHLYALYADASNIAIKGYLENRTFLNFNASTSSTGRNRAKVELEAKPIKDKAYVNLTADFMSFYGDLSRAKALLPSNSILSDFSEGVILDRSYLRLNFKRWQVIAGKQRLAWGQSLRWSPFDVFNRINIVEPTEEKAGINAFRFLLPFSATSGIESAIVPQFDLGQSSYGFRYYLSLPYAGVQLYAIKDTLDITPKRILGVALKGDLELGWWFEGAYVREKHNPASRFEMVIGNDYTLTLGDGLYMMLEYRYNGSGQSDPMKYDYLRLLSQRRPFLGRNYISFMTRYNFIPPLSSVIIYTANLDDKSGSLIPNLQYQLFQDVQLIIGLNLFLGKGEYNLPKGKLPFDVDNQAYLWLRADF